MTNIFHDPTVVLPKKHGVVVGIDMSQSEIAGRHDHVPDPDPETGAEVRLEHVAESRTPRPTLGHYRRQEFREKWRK